MEKELYEHESQKLGILILIAKLVLPIKYPNLVSF